MLIWLVLGLAVGSMGRRGVGRQDTSPHRDVATTQGTVRGYLSPNGYTYLGVPYARPHARDRFKAPEPPPHWDGIFEATHRVRCHHAIDNCLVVNIFTPEYGTSLPVLVYIHAGGFQTGWGPHHPPSHLLRKGIVVVTFNYRLGVRGFLCLGQTQATGNAGIKDQVAALYWVQRNIAKFGGNPHDVTLYGTEAGGASIHILLLSVISEGLFHKIMLESGSVLSPSSITYNSVGTALVAARQLGYEEDEDPVKLLKFYHQLKEKKLSTISEIFLPCVENATYYSNSLLEDDPKILLTEGKFQKVPMLIAYTNAENLISDEDSLNIFPEEFDQLLPNNLEFESDKTRHQVAELVKDLYFGYDNTDLGEKYAKYVHHVFTEYPVITSGLLLAMRNSHPVFLMRFDNTIDKNKQNSSHHFKTIFDYIYPTTNDNLENKEIADILLTLWSNFIKLGDPTPLTTEMIPIIWEPVMPEEFDHRIGIDNLRELVIGKTIRMMEPVSKQYLAFWEHIYRKFYKSHKVRDN